MSVEILERMFGAANRGDSDAFLGCFTEDAEYQAANKPAMHGRQAIQEFRARMAPSFKKVLHNVKNSWQKGDTVVCELDVEYHRNDGKVVTVPCLDIIRLKDGKVKSLRAYLDAGPAFM